MSTQKSGCLTAVLIVMLCLSLFFNFALLAYKTTKVGQGRLSRSTELPEFDEKTVVEATAAADGKIVRLDLRGIITSAEDGALGETMIEDFTIALNQAVEDSAVKAIVVQIDSPGGEVTASDIMYQAVRKARERKPIVIYMSSVAASGGYYIACGGSWLMANETTITGSIGVIIQTLNYQQLFGKIGLEAITFKSGEFKDILSGSRQMTPEEKAYIQALVMQTYDKFVGIVADERKLLLDELKTGIADGRIVSGKDALAAKLVNAVGSLEDAYAKARELGGAPGAAVVRYEAGFKLGRLFEMLGESRANKVEISLGDALVPKLETGKLYLLPSFYLP